MAQLTALQRYDERRQTSALIKSMVPRRMAADVERTARHEIAHALVAKRLRCTVQSIAVDFDDGGGEVVADGAGNYRAQMLINLAGPVADALHGGGALDLHGRRVGRDMEAIYKARRAYRRKPANDARAIAKAAAWVQRFLTRPNIMEEADSLLRTLVEKKGIIEYAVIEHAEDTITAQVLAKVKPRQSAAFRALMQSADEFWKTSGAL